MLILVILYRWILASPERADQLPPLKPPVDTSIINGPKLCRNCGSTLVPLALIDRSLPDGCHYCGIDYLPEVRISNKSGILVRDENYRFPPPPEFVNKNDTIYLQPSGIITLSKVEGTYTEKYIQKGYRFGQQYGIKLCTDQEAALLYLLSQQSKEIRGIKDKTSKNEYIVKNRYEFVVECKQIEVFEKGKIKNNPDNPNTLRNAFDSALRQHSSSAQRNLSLLIHFCIKYQNRLPFFYQNDYLQEFIDELPDRSFLIASIGFLTDQSYCEIHTKYQNSIVKADNIINTIEEEMDSI